MNQFTFGVAGRYKLDVHGPDGELRRSTGWFNNLILNNGLDLIGSTDQFVNACQVGTGNTTPAPTQTALTARVAGTTSQLSSTTGAAGSSPYYGYLQRTWQFTPGQATGNISEVGVGPVTTNNLFSRALILDGGGSPTTITVLSDEYLNVTYELRYYPPASDWTGTVTISGTDYDVVYRACAVTSAGAYSIGRRADISASALNTFFYSGTLGAVTATSPGGTNYVPLAQTTAAYGAGDHYIDATVTSKVNEAETIQCLRLLVGLGAFQLSLDPVIDKTNIQQVTLTSRIAWAAHSI